MTDANPIGAAIAAARRNNPAMSFPQHRNCVAAVASLPAAI